MKVIGTSNEGNPIVELDVEFRGRILDALQTLAQIPVMKLSEAEALRPAGHDGAAVLDDLPAAEKPAGKAAEEPVSKQQPAQKGKAAAKRPSRKKGALLAERTCEACGKAYTPKRCDQKVCNKECRRVLENRKKRQLAGKPKEQPKPEAPPVIDHAAKIKDAALMQAEPRELTIEQLQERLKRHRRLGTSDPAARLVLMEKLGAQD